MIPQICHLNWTTGSPLAWLQLVTIHTFHKLNPDWHIIIHLMKQRPEEMGRNTYVPNYTGPDYFKDIPSYVEIREVDLKAEGIALDKPPFIISDIWRREILYKHGGLYSDFDVIWLRPMDYLQNIECLGNPSDFEGTVSFFEYTHGFHNCSNIISEPGSPFLKAGMEEVKKIKPPYGHLDFGTWMLNRMYPTWNDVVTKHPRMLALKYETFYPYSIYHLEELFLKTNLKPLENDNVMCVHWFNGHGLAKEYLNKEDYARECSMTKILNDYA